MASLAGCASVAPRSSSAPKPKRPNILFAIADDWSWPHASMYGAPEISTPAFDRVAREGMVFHNAFTAAPQCSPNRAALLTGRHIWQIEEAGTHASIFPTTYPVFTDLLEDAGYHVGYTRKGWGPGDWKRGGWSRNPAGPEYSERTLDNVPYDGLANVDYTGNFDVFLEARPDGAPFFFWYGSSEPHLRYEQGSGIRSGKNHVRVRVPEFLPDDPTVRSDMLDYFVEIEWFDSQLALMLQRLDELGELDNTVVVVTSDNGMPFPRAKANLYDYGTHVPFAIRWPERFPQGRSTDALMSFVDFAPTFLDLAGVNVPETMVGATMTPLLAGKTDSYRDHVVTGRERHTHARYDNWGYPSRAIRTEDYLYIRNFKPDRWPAGDPPEYHDIDESPTKRLVMEGSEWAELLEAAVGKRPEDELYAIQEDPACLNNLASDPAHQRIMDRLRDNLMSLLTEQGDPRALGTGDIFESYPRVSPMRPELGGFAERGEYNPAYQL
ncbi:MAG: sulfatase [Candidatus Hydrogenedentes bacterium]|nr:sulfatase [Candidatus Hydrogenedentota bacterium]